MEITGEIMHIFEKKIITPKSQGVLCGDKPNNECKEIINSMNNSIKHLEDERESKQNKMLFFENQLSIFQPY